MKKIIFILFLFTSILATSQQVANENRKTLNSKSIIFFELNRYNLSDNYKAILDSIASELKDKEYRIKLIGHADSLGSVNKNLTLSMKRTKTVEDYLQSKGLDTSRIILKYYGESKPVFNNSSEEELVKNRCVEILVSFIKTIPENNLTQGYTRKPKFENDTTLTCKNGAQIIISSGAFYPYKLSDINFNITEEYSVCDILQSNSTLQAEDGNCLTSAGMIYIRPTLNKIEVQPNKGQLITIKIPMMGGKLDPQMKVYFAKLDSSGRMVWQPKDSELTYENLGTQYYVFRVDTLIGFNLDKTIGIMCQKNGPRIKVKKYKNVEVYQTYPDEVYLSRGVWNKKKKVHIIDSVIIQKKPQITVLAYDKYGNPMVAQGPLSGLEFNKRKNYYVLRPEFFKPLQRNGDGKQTVKDDLCTFMKN